MNKILIFENNSNKQMAFNENSIINNGFLFKNGRYEVLGLIGEGGFGVVYLVKDKQSEGEEKR